LGTPRRGWKDNIKMGLTKQGVVLIRLMCLRTGTSGGLLWTW
jgi:hypothetical protein